MVLCVCVCVCAASAIVNLNAKLFHFFSPFNGIHKMLFREILGRSFYLKAIMHFYGVKYLALTRWDIDYVVESELFDPMCIISRQSERHLMFE